MAFEKPVALTSEQRFSTSQFGMNIEPSLIEQARRFRRLSKQTFRNPNSEHVHDLRVVTRRLRTDFWLIPKADRTRCIRKSRDELRHLARVLGAQRKYDVALQDATHFLVNSEKIERRLKASRKGVLASLQPKKRKRYSAHLKRAVYKAAQIPGLSLGPQIEVLARGFAFALRTPPKRNTAIHRLRIELKKARYLLEAFGHRVPEIVKLQDHLGRWHDLMVLSGLCGHPPNVVAAQKSELRRAERILKDSLIKTNLALSSLNKRLISQP